jgi:hypothetical protein
LEQLLRCENKTELGFNVNLLLAPVNCLEYRKEGEKEKEFEVKKGVKINTS